MALIAVMVVAMVGAAPAFIIGLAIREQRLRAGPAD
jgi:hypothetical protein